MFDFLHSPWNKRQPCTLQAAGLMKEGAKPPQMSPQDIIEFIFFPVVNEGCRVIAEGIVDKPADLDVATVLSMGFPAYRWAFYFPDWAAVSLP